MGEVPPSIPFETQYCEPFIKPECKRVRARMDAYGCIDDGQKACSALAGAAQHEFARIYAHVPDSRDKDFIGELPAWVIERS